MRTLRAVLVLSLIIPFASTLRSQEVTGPNPPKQETTSKPAEDPVGTIHNPGFDTTPPVVLESKNSGQSELEPQHAKPAYRRTVSLVVIVGKDGIPHDVKVAKPVGKGLDEKAIEAVKGWRFRPGMWKGEPVATRIFIDITFSLYNSQILLDPPTSEEQSPTMVDGIGLVYRVGNGITAPKVKASPDPEYPKDARKEGHEGTSVLWVIVDAKGKPRNIRVKSAAGHGLDEKAIEAVSNWKFKPASKDGHPVAVQINVEINFAL